MGGRGVGVQDTVFRMFLRTTSTGTLLSSLSLTSK